MPGLAAEAGKAGLASHARKSNRSGGRSGLAPLRRLAPGVPFLQTPADRPHRAPAVVPAGARPELEVQVAIARVAGPAEAADPLAGAHPLAVPRAVPAPQVHVDVVVSGGLAVDHQVVARAAGLVAAPLHPAAPGRDNLRAAPGADVLPLVVAGRRRSRPSSHAAPGPGTCAGRGGTERASSWRDCDPRRHRSGVRTRNTYLPLRSPPPPVGARPADRLLGAGLHVVASPGPHHPPVAATHCLDLQVPRPAAGDRVAIGGLPGAVEEHLAGAGALRPQPQPARAELALDPEPPLRRRSPPLAAVGRRRRRRSAGLAPAPRRRPPSRRRSPSSTATATSVAGRPPGAPGACALVSLFALAFTPDSSFSGLRG